MVLRNRWGRGAGALVFLLVMATGCVDNQGPDAVIHVVELTPMTSVITVGDTVRLTARPKGPDGQVRGAYPVNWTNRHPTLVTLAGTGQTVEVVGVRAGLAEINAGALEKIGVAMVEVRNPAPEVTGLQPSQVMAGAPGVELVVRGVGFVQGSMVHWNGSARATQYVSGTELRATIPVSDVATVGQGSVRVVNAAPGGGVSAEQLLPVVASLVYVDMRPDTATVESGRTVTLTATARDIHGNDLGLPLAWYSTNPAIATVNASGVVTGVSTGIATIVAHNEAVSGTALIRVNPSAIATPQIASISPDSVPSQPGGVQITIRGSGFLESTHAFINGSSRPSDFVSDSVMTIHLWEGDVATSGTRTIRVSNGGAAGMSNAALFRVVPGVWSVQIAPSQIELWPGEQQVLMATAADEQGRPVTGRPATWSSTNEAVATVDSTGRVRAVAAGATLIRAVVDGRTGFAQVTVLETLQWDVLYEGNHGGISELWLLTVAPNTAPRRLLPAGTYGADPAVSPDGSQIAYVGIGSNGHMNIFVVNRDGTNARQLTFTQDLNDQPAWSRDGSRIAFRRSGERSDVWVMNADGTSQTNVTNNASRTDAVYAAERPTWTSNGRVVFTFGYQLVNPLAYLLVSVRPDGTDWKNLTSGAFREFEPEVSPNGQHIALRRASESTGEYIDVIAADGSSLGWISLPGSGRTPSWSPDNTMLTFSHGTSAGQSDIYAWRFGATTRRLLVQGGRNPVFIRR